jgi:hypothetical protein
MRLQRSMGGDAVALTPPPATQDRVGVVHISRCRNHSEEIAPGVGASSNGGNRPGVVALGYIGFSAAIRSSLTSAETKPVQACLVMMASPVAEAERTTLVVGCRYGGDAVIGDAECVDEAESDDVVERKVLPWVHLRWQFANTRTCYIGKVMTCSW